ncbi:hypothetical protein LX32DRAFT_257372 [Colletotrichum zoysiae]|uniref:GRF-like zinc ribbon domain-containing protein n=1 Tax=Colletotrichum zoysiae TaxID=1216348 RepID=A0AAD9HNW0_9PEZI|nr:hypothetical protein LX32DRAFT_257372 [Colletotrichum zoysiae]
MWHQERGVLSTVHCGMDVMTSQYRLCAIAQILRYDSICETESETLALILSYHIQQKLFLKHVNPKKPYKSLVTSPGNIWFVFLLTSHHIQYLIAPSYPSNFSCHQGTSSSTESNMTRALRLAPPKQSAAALKEIPPPDCGNCKAAARRYITGHSNRKGNAGRPYYRCCGVFYCFADLRGYHPDNPRCNCDRPSRMQIAGPERNPPGGLHYVCMWGGCDFYLAHVDENGKQECFSWRRYGETSPTRCN